MQIYSNAVKVKIRTTNHGERTFLITARSIVEAINELESLMRPWAADDDFHITASYLPDDFFVVVTERAFKGETP